MDQEKSNLSKFIHISIIRTKTNATPIGDSMITKMSNAESEKLVSINNAVKSAQRTIMAIGIKSNPILKIIQKLNSAIVFVQIVLKSFIQILTYMMKTSDYAAQPGITVDRKKSRQLNYPFPYRGCCCFFQLIASVPLRLRRLR